MVKNIVVILPKFMLQVKSRDKNSNWVHLASLPNRLRFLYKQNSFNFFKQKNGLHIQEMN